MSYASNLPPGSLYDDSAPWNSGDAPGSLVERSERIDYPQPPMDRPEPSAANLAWRKRLAATAKETR